MKIALLAVGTIATFAVTTPTEVAQARGLQFMNGIGYQQRLKESRDAYTKAWEAQQQPQIAPQSKKKKRSAQQ